MKKQVLFLLTAVVLMLCGCGGLSNTRSAAADTGEARVSITDRDVGQLTDFLLKRTSGETLQNLQYDRNGDGKWSALDLCRMKRELLAVPAGDSRVLVVYFSRTNNTERIADYIVNAASADRYEIQAAVPYTDADINYSDSSCRANQEQKDKAVRPAMAEPAPSLDAYDVIFLGYPIWWGGEPRIVDTFLESSDLSDKTVIPFCTSASSGIGTSEENIRQLVPIGNLLPGKRFSASASEESVHTWVAGLGILSDKAEKLYLTINGTRLSASLEDNSSVQALLEKLTEGDIRVDAHDYGSFEKVGSLGVDLPRNDMQITTKPGDLIFYQGNQFVLYYDENTWSFTKLGHVDISQAELKALLGDGNVTITLSLQ